MPRNAQMTVDGDTRFTGIAPRLDPASLPEGIASEGENVRFRNGVAESRRGMYKPPWANNITPEIDNKIRPFTTVHGVGVFRNPDTNLEFIIIAADNKVYYTRQNNNPLELALPTGVNITGTVNFTQAFNKMIMFRGDDFAPLVLTSEDTGFVDMIDQWDLTAAYAVDDEVAFGPLVSVTGITHSGGTATATTSAAYGYVTGADVTIAGANEAAFNGRFNITVTGDTTFTYTGGTGASATGTITATNNKDYYICTTITTAGESPSTASSKWSQLATIMPNATHGVHIANRVVAPTKFDASATSYLKKRDFVTCSDLLDHSHTFFDQVFRVNAGTDDEIVDVAVYDENRLLVFKEKSIHMITAWIVTNTNATLSASISVQPIIQNYGVPHRGAAVVVGGNVYFYASQRGIVSLAQTEQSKVRGVDLPLSEPIQPLIDRIDPRHEDKIRLAYWDNKLYVACPIDDGASGNNAILIYDFINQAWASHDSGGAINPAEWFIATYDGAQRLFYVGVDGFLNLVEENWAGDDEADLTQDDGLKTTDIAAMLLTRGYKANDTAPRDFRTATVALATWNPKYTIETITDGVNESQTLVSDRTKDRTKYYRPFDAAAFDESNVGSNFGTAYREDYSVKLNVDLDSLLTEGGDEVVTEGGDTTQYEAAIGGFLLGNGVVFNRMQETSEPFVLTPRQGRFTQIKTSVSQGRVELSQVTMTSKQGDRTVTVKS